MSLTVCSVPSFRFSLGIAVMYILDLPYLASIALIFSRSFSGLPLFLFSLFLSSMFIILSLQFFFACSKLSLFTVVRKIPVKSTLSSVRKITMFFLDPGGNCHTLKMSKIPNKCVLQTQKHIALWLSQ